MIIQNKVKQTQTKICVFLTLECGPLIGLSLRHLLWQIERRKIQNDKVRENKMQLLVLSHESQKEKM